MTTRHHVKNTTHMSSSKLTNNWNSLKIHLMRIIRIKLKLNGNFFNHILNSSRRECVPTKSETCCIICIRFLSEFAMSLIEIIVVHTSFTIAFANIKQPRPMANAIPENRNKYNVRMYSTMTAKKYPVGECQSKGIL